MKLSAEQNQFGRLLEQAREAAGLSRRVLAQRLKLATSYVYRLEVGDRRPSRETVLALTEALGVNDEVVNAWLLTAGHAPMPLFTSMHTAIRTRGGKRRPGGRVVSPSSWDPIRLTQRLEAMGLHEAMVGRLLQVLDTQEPAKQQDVARIVSATFSRIAEMLEAPVHTAVIPAAGGQHRLLASQVMQRLLLRSIREAAESGISNIILVLTPGTVEALYTPLKDALDLAVVPPLKLHCVEQPKPEGLGDAILHAEKAVGEQPFAVLLPDDVVRERIGRMASPRELRRMMEALKQLGRAQLLAVASVPKSKMVNCGVVQVETKAALARILLVSRLVEKPDLDHEICRATRVLGIVGRYLLQPEIFHFLHQLKKKGKRPLHLTEALEHMCQEGHGVYAFPLAAQRQDIGAVLGQAHELIEDVSEQGYYVDADQDEISAVGIRPR